MKLMASLRSLASGLCIALRLKARWTRSCARTSQTAQTISSVPACRAPKRSAARASSSAARNDTRRNAAKNVAASGSNRFGTMCASAFACWANRVVSAPLPSLRWPLESAQTLPSSAW